MQKLETQREHARTQGTTDHQQHFLAGTPSSMAHKETQNSCCSGCTPHSFCLPHHHPTGRALARAAIAPTALAACAPAITAPEHNAALASAAQAAAAASRASMARKLITSLQQQDCSASIYAHQGASSVRKSISVLRETRGRSGTLMSSRRFLLKHSFRQLHTATAATARRR